MSRDVEGLSAAKLWALQGLAARPDGMSPSMLGQHMSDRPGVGRKGASKLNRSQGYGRLGAYMASLLRKAGLAATAPAHTSGPTYMRTTITLAGRRALAPSSSESET